MWIAKNSITNKTYGKPFKDIYDCQTFIDNHLKLLEYEMQRAFSMEKEILEDIEISGKSKGLASNIMLRFQLSFRDFEKTFTREKMKLIIEDCFTKKKNERDLDEKLTKLAKTKWLKNNIIRCWNTEQDRFADGFDF